MIRTTPLAPVSHAGGEQNFRRRRVEGGADLVQIHDGKVVFFPFGASQIRPSKAGKIGKCLLRYSLSLLRMTNCVAEGDDDGIEREGKGIALPSPEPGRLMQMTPRDKIPGKLSTSASALDIAMGSREQRWEFMGTGNTTADRMNLRATGADLLRLYEAAVGQFKTARYTEKFEEFDLRRSGLHSSWNWAAFFFGPAWCLYRKLYLWAAVHFLVYFAIGRLVELKILPAAGQAYVLFSWCLVFATLADSTYHRAVMRMADSALVRLPDVTSRIRQLEQAGGVHKWLPIVLGALFVTGVVAGVVLPLLANNAGSRHGPRALSWEEVQKKQPSPSPASNSIEKTLPFREWRSAYTDRVTILRNAARDGRLAVVSAALPTIGTEVSEWSHNDAATLASQQTWWIIKADVFVHVVNRTRQTLISFEVAYMDLDCGASIAAQHFTVHLEQAIPPGSEALVQFGSGSTTEPQDACLTITRAWAPA